MRAMFLKLRRRLGASEEKIRNFARLVALALRRSSGVTESPTPARSGNQSLVNTIRAALWLLPHRSALGCFVCLSGQLMPVVMMQLCVVRRIPAQTAIPFF